ncbi:gamma-glutamyltransferase [Erythrobacter sp. NFXS35]|uniref:gamma-glutamyltransferase family protein n=1 Tax=Erythrobacter sp. NFXS35 TaxID=2818436 RepID=UPI0032DF83E1
MYSLKDKSAMVVAPHRLAAEAGCEILQQGGSAIEAMVAAAATIAVVYPHMNGIGGDAFWLIAQPDQPVIAIDGAGRAGAKVCLADYRSRYPAEMPTRGPKAVLTVPGAVASWQSALGLREAGRVALPLGTLLAGAIDHAERGFAVSMSQASATREKFGQLAQQPHFAETYLHDGQAPEAGDLMRLPALAATLRRLASAGLDDFYRGETSRALSEDLARAGATIDAGDLEQAQAPCIAPLWLRRPGGTAYNLGAPTQGLVSLLILAIFDEARRRMSLTPAQRVHVLIEATKIAFEARDRFIGDPDGLTLNLQSLLDPCAIAASTDRISLEQCLPWGPAQPPADTVWMGAIDHEGIAVSFIQSVYWEFGSGVVSPNTGVLLQNRGIAFSLDEHSHNALRAGAKPFHTLNPALMRGDDGSTMVYGSMGGEGQPQFQAAILNAIELAGGDIGAGVAAPRWLLGRTWGEDSSALHIEADMAPAISAALVDLGHPVRFQPPRSEMLGHAGAILRTVDGRVSGATDPRSDGGACGY